jgi:hypothetical protein
VTLAHRDLPGVLADPRLVLALGNAGEIRAAFPSQAGVSRILHAPLVPLFAPELAVLAGTDPRDTGAGSVTRTRPRASDS